MFTFGLRIVEIEKRAAIFIEHPTVARDALK
jgi:hypothetical protein